MHHLKIDRFAAGTSAVHGLDPRTKLLAAILYSLAVISVGPYEVAVLFVYAIGPFAVLTAAEVPMRFVLRQMFVLMPFVAVLAVTSIFYDQRPVGIQFGPFAWETSAGMVRCVNILLKFAATLSALIGLAATTRFSDLTAGLEKMRVPAVLVMQLSFLYRYIFVLVDKAAHMLRARRARKVGRLALRREVSIASALIGKLFSETVETAERVNFSMRARGFSGHFRLAKELRFSRGDGVFAAVFVGFMLFVIIADRWV